MRIFPQSNFAKGFTILQKINEVQKYLQENPIYNTFFVNVPWEPGDTNVQIYNSSILNLNNRKVSVGDIVQFNNSYYGAITATFEDTYFIVGQGFLNGAVGPQGPQGPQGPKGETGATGLRGLTGLAMPSILVESEVPVSGTVITVNFTDFNRKPNSSEGIVFYVLANGNYYLCNGYVDTVNTVNSTATINVNMANNIAQVISTATVRNTEYSSASDVYSCDFMNNVINSFTAEVSQEQYIHFIEIKASGKTGFNILRATYISNYETPYTATTPQEKTRFFDDIKNQNLKPLYIPSTHITYKTVNTKVYYEFYMGVNIGQSGAVENLNSVFAKIRILVIVDNGTTLNSWNVSSDQAPYVLFTEDDIYEITDTVSSVKGSN